MKCVVLRKSGSILSVENSETPDRGHPKAGEIRVHASSLNAHDANVLKGILPVADGRILLTDAAGVVEKIGSGVSQFSVGDKVISTFFPDWQNGPATTVGFDRTPGDGLDGYATEAVVRPEHFFTKAPDGWSFTEAATLPTAGLTVWRALIGEGQLRPGQDVLLLGTGGVSVLAIQLAKRMGARVLITSSSDVKLKRASELGADFGVNYRNNRDWPQAVLDFTAGRGADLVVETGGPGTLPQSIQAARVGGKIVLVGVVTGAAGTVPTAALMVKQQQLHGIMVGSRQDQLEMVRGLNALGLRPIIDQTFALSELKCAFEFHASGDHFGKIAITC
jgi:NADPH:quinone reductase-like Zn-dependent oxidoreductase